MKKTTLAIIIAIVAVGALAGIYFFREDKPNTSTPEISTQQSDSDTTKNDQTSTKTYPAAEVARHNTESDCWTIINGNVYDITDYIPRHPGGDEILQACGEDGTSLFTQRQTDSGEDVGSGTPHSSSAASQLERLKIGTLR